MEMENNDSLDALHEEVYEHVVEKNFNKDSLMNLLKQRKCKTPYKYYILDLIMWAAINGKNERIKQFLLEFVYDDFNDEKLKFYPIISCFLEGITDLGFNIVANFVPDKWMNNVYLSAQSDDHILILGETGTSKQLMAKAIHSMSDRRNNPFEEINCSAIPETMLESELFGHEKGTFTGADRKKKGRFELAENGTIFMDELGKMPKNLQAKILRVLEDKKVNRLGSDQKPILLNVRFIAAAQPDDLKDSIIPDLIFRLGYPDCINMPTLKERMRINAYAVIDGSLERAKRRMQINHEIAVNENVISLLKEYDFKGNYRELENILKYGIKYMLMDDRREIVSSDILNVLDRNRLYIDENMSTKNIKFKDIIEHANDVSRSIILHKIGEIYASGKSCKGVLTEEGLKKRDFQNFYKKIRNITGKNLRDIKNGTAIIQRQSEADVKSFPEKSR